MYYLCNEAFGVQVGSQTGSKIAFSENIWLVWSFIEVSWGKKHPCIKAEFSWFEHSAGTKGENIEAYNLVQIWCRRERYSGDAWELSSVNNKNGIKLFITLRKMKRNSQEKQLKYRLTVKRPYCVSATI